MLSEKEILRQKQLLENGKQYIELIAPATTSRGINVIDNKQDYINIYDENSKKFSIMKFVPASGAATRLLKRLISFHNKSDITTFEDGKEFSVAKTISSLDKFAFFEKLESKVTKKDYTCIENIVAKILYEPLNLVNLPKGLIPFHRYDNFSLTPFEEHLNEAIKLDISFRPKIEFTISNEHYSLFSHLLNYNSDKYKVDVNFSYQDKKTDTIAMYENGELVKTENGELFTRPGGHGSLLKNLNNIDADIIFIKNIDNVVHQDYLDDTLPYKKMLGGILIELVEKIKDFTHLLDNDASAENCNKVANFLEEKFYANFDRSSIDFCKNLQKFMHRPLRVCGMVKNTGEPGGGPFFVKKENSISLQIVEKAEINLLDKEQESHFKASTHFNPVDLVCYIKDAAGNKFNLKEFADENACFISEKTYNGKNIKVLEHPGLWNGAMSNWLTFFVEVPLFTFNPVKELNDLLRAEHQPKE